MKFFWQSPLALSHGQVGCATTSETGPTGTERRGKVQAEDSGGFGDCYSGWLRNPAPVDLWFIRLLVSNILLVVQDFFHPQ